MIELLYVSRAAAAPAELAGQLRDILGVARRRNMELGVTGALIRVGDLYAQLLEGDPNSVNRLMVSILRDPRHRDVRIVRVNDIGERRFATWSMAEIAPDPAATDLVRALSAPAYGSAAETGEALIRLMVALAGSARLGPA